MEVECNKLNKNNNFIIIRIISMQKKENKIASNKG